METEGQGMMSDRVGRWSGVRARMSGGLGRAPAATRARAHESTGLSSAKIHHEEEEMEEEEQLEVVEVAVAEEEQGEARRRRSKEKQENDLQESR